MSNYQNTMVLVLADQIKRNEYPLDQGTDCVCFENR